MINSHHKQNTQRLQDIFYVMKSNLWHKSQIGEQKLEVLLYISYAEQ